jgi:hypothetical protein
MAAPGVAAKDAAHGQVAAFEWAIFSNGLYAILAAGGRVAAVAAQVWGYKQLIPPDEQNKKPGNEVAYHNIKPLQNLPQRGGFKPAPPHLPKGEALTAGPSNLPKGEALTAYNPLNEMPKDHSLRLGPRLVLRTPRRP